MIRPRQIYSLTLRKVHGFMLARGFRPEQLLAGKGLGLEIGWTTNLPDQGSLGLVQITSRTADVRSISGRRAAPCIILSSISVRL